MTLQTIFFDIGETLVFDDPPLRERLGTALCAAQIPYSPSHLSSAFRVGEEVALTSYLSGLPWDDPAVMQSSLRAILVALDAPPLSDSALWDVLESLQAVPFVRRVHPGVIPLLRRLSEQGFDLGVISDWDASLPDLLAGWGLMPFFQAVAVSDLVGARKPSRAIFDDALRQAGASPERSLHIGDWYAVDVLGARQAGMHALLFDHAGRTPDADCDRATTFQELECVLLALPKPT